MTYFVQIARDAGAEVEKVHCPGVRTDGFITVTFEIHQLEAFVFACINEELAGELTVL